MVHTVELVMYVIEIEFDELVPQLVGRKTVIGQIWCSGWRSLALTLELSLAATTDILKLRSSFGIVTAFWWALNTA